MANTVELDWYTAAPRATTRAGMAQMASFRIGTPAGVSVFGSGFSAGLSALVLVSLLLSGFGSGWGSGSGVMLANASGTRR
ncbi:hypothetical protein ABZ215_25010 [Amycolatopsis sp. NPDC006131]|uniref:hypothetical protein n=1 Tax=Amycolatopsis sp. NPDC006131 TaxID=3156731 RepID=UPI0033B6222B